jgi:hypothetical protein
MQRHMKSFTTYIVDLMKKERLFASQGGNIVLAQVVTVFPVLWILVRTGIEGPGRSNSLNSILVFLAIDKLTES